MTTTAPTLTINDPVPAETLQHLKQLQGARAELADQLADLEQGKVRILRNLNMIDNEKQRLFDNVLLSRGLPPGTQVSIDANTGKITLGQD